MSKLIFLDVDGMIGGNGSYVEHHGQVLIQTYQAAIDNEGKVLGFWETIYDLKQPLKTYLDNSAQALVAWSDATSGASFKEETDF